MSKTINKTFWFEVINLGMQNRVGRVTLDLSQKAKELQITNKYFSYLKLHMHPVGLEPTTSICTLLWHVEAVPFELELTDK